MTNVTTEFFADSERPFSDYHEYAVPVDLQLAGQNLVWQRFTSSSKPTGINVRPHPEMLDQFLRLSDADDEEILRYARRWGVFNLCPEHLLPASHNPDCEPFLNINSKWSEPISEWRKISRMMQSIFSIAYKLSNKQVASASDWSVLRDEGWLGNIELLKDFDKNDKKYQKAFKYQRRSIANVINIWITISALQPVLRWDDNFSGLSFTGSPKSKLCGALVSQLLLTSGRSSLMSCSECRSWYTRTAKLPKRGQANYCSDCRKRGVPERNASREYRARQKNADKRV
jgi:hypothetical protein